MMNQTTHTSVDMLTDLTAAAEHFTLTLLNGDKENSNNKKKRLKTSKCNPFQCKKLVPCTNHTALLLKS